MKTIYTIKRARAAMLLLVMLAMTLTASASATNFITDVMLIGHDDEDEFYTLQTSLVNQGWTPINKDLNAGASGHYIHLLYKKQTSTGSSGVPITDFYIKTGKNPPANLTHDGRTYYLVPCQGDDDFEGGQGDLNEGAGGKYIHLYYTKDVLPSRHAVTAITFNDTQSGGVGANGDNTTGYDLNSGAGGNYIYMHLTTVHCMVTLTSATGEIQLQNGDTLTGTGGSNTHVTIAAGATVILSGASITSIPNDINHKWAGLSCLGDAIIVLAEGTTNNIAGGDDHPGIYVPQNHTLTLQGSGTLNATGQNYSAGIGGGRYQISCGNITINGGNITANGGATAAGIGGGHNQSSCGNITINGGNITANGGGDAAGIGGGNDQSSCGNITISGGNITAKGVGHGAGIGGGSENSGCGNITISGGNITANGGANTPGIGGGNDQSSCGNITITNGVTRVTAITGSYYNYAIGAGSGNSTCGTITIGGVETGFISQSPFVTFPYTVAFNANGGTGTMDNQEFMYNVAQNLNANNFTRAYYLFDGWATSANGAKVYDNQQSVLNLADTIATVTLYAKWNYGLIKEIVGYGDVSNPGGWYLIASPVVEAIVPSFDNGFITNAFDLYYFDPSFVGEEWRNYKVEDFFLTNGTGYLYASEIATTLTFTGTPYTGDGEIELAYDSNVPDFGGWNLVGNPYPATAYVDRDFYVMNNDGSELIAAEGSAVEAMDGIFVVADNENEVVHFTPTDPGKTQSKIVLSVTQGRGSVIDRAIVRFGEDRTMSKFQLNPNHTKVYIPMDGKDYAIANVTEMDEMPVNFKAEKNGTYTFSFSTENIEMGYLHLIDNMTGNDVDLLETPSYTFEARTTDYASRFKLAFAADTSDNDNFAFISNGNIIINGDGTVQVIDVLGHVLISREVNSSLLIPHSSLTPGVYMLNLVNGNDVKTQKIVVR